MTVERTQLSRIDIEKLLPHRRPFLFLESARIIEPGIHATGTLADLSENDFSFLKGHFPNYPITPGAILMEALAELLGVAALSGASEQQGKIGLLASDRMKYRQPVYPGDNVQLDARITAMRRSFGRGVVKALKGGGVAAEGEITFVLVDRGEEFNALSPIK